MTSVEIEEKQRIAPKRFVGNLRGQNFKGQNLADADFSGADVCGAKFVDADLRGAKFIGAEAGVQMPWLAIQLFLIFITLALLSCISSTLSTLFVGYWFAFTVPTDAITSFSLYFAQLLSLC